MEFRLTIVCSFLLLYNIPLQQCVYPFLFCCAFGFSFSAITNTVIKFLYMFLVNMCMCFRLEYT